MSVATSGATCSTPTLAKIAVRAANPADSSAQNNQVGSTWVGGFVAHHYTRYLGDLSGGLFIGKLMQRRFGFDTNGIGFYIFADIADPKEFKEHYRVQLDSAPWDEAEKERVIDEVLLAYRFNTELFEDLARAKAEAAA